jgi:hypothetical protein
MSSQLFELLRSVSSINEILAACSITDELTVGLTPDTVRSHFPEPEDLDSIEPNTPGFFRVTALVLLVPVPLFPMGMFDCARFLLRSLRLFDPLVQNSILMRFSQSAVLGNLTQRAISLISPAFPLAFLYLSVACRAPVDLDSATFVQTGRIGGLTFYYSGLNHLFLRGFEVAGPLVPRTQLQKLSRFFVRNCAVVRFVVFLNALVAEAVSGVVADALRLS